MNPDRIPELIARIALADPRVRRTDEAEQIAQIDMWAGILADVPYEYALDAAQRHYATTAWPILPADIATRWQAVVRDRMNRDADPEPPNVDPDDEEAYRHQLAARRQAVAHGHTPPVGYRELTAVPAEVQARLDTVGRYMPEHARQALAAYRPVAAAREAALREGRPDPLAVPCPWCAAPTGQPCRTRTHTPGRDPEIGHRGRRAPHPSRIDAATAHHNAA